MPRPVDQWAVRILRWPGQHTAQLVHAGPYTGFQVLEEMAWPLGPDVITERAYLAELYDACLQFMELRA